MGMDSLNTQQMFQIKSFIYSFFYTGIIQVYMVRLNQAEPFKRKNTMNNKHFERQKKKVILIRS